MLKNSFGYVIVKWEATQSENEEGYAQVTFTVLDAEKGKKEKIVGHLKYYGEKIPRHLPGGLGRAIIDAQYYQRHETPPVD